MHDFFSDPAGQAREALTDAARAALNAGDPAALRALVQEVHPGIFTAQLVSKSWCRELLSELDRFDSNRRDEGDPPTPPNSMHNYGVVLAEAGLDEAMNWLATQILSPFAVELFPDLCPQGLVAQHAFLADYAEDRDIELSLHVDQSDVTLDLCLGTDFEGGELVLEGPRCFGHLDHPPRVGERFVYSHVPGTALIHAGKNRHCALPITAGRSAQLVLWGRVRSEPEQPDPSVCPAWCGAR